jgi:hypothetical protein
LAPHGTCLVDPPPESREAGRVRRAFAVEALVDLEPGWDPRALVAPPG